MKIVQILSCGVAAAAFFLVPMTSCAQDITITPPAEVAAFMAACTPVNAQGPDIRDAMMDRGWASFSPEDRLAGVQNLSAALLWSYYPYLLDSERVENFGLVVDGVGGAADGETAALLGFGEQIALILWNGDSLSCLWAGPQSEALDTLAVQLGGFIESDGVTTRAIDQTVEADGREWARRMAVARTPVADLPAEVADRAVTDAARLDRSPR
jgi:hypothetical protein